MIIKNYEALINKDNGTCAIIINSKQHNIKFFKNEDLKYEILENKIDIFSEKHKISIINIDNELKYYAYKTNTLVILTGTNTNNISNFDGFYEAILI